MSEDLTVTPELMLQAYAAGLFPMGDPDRPGQLDWYDPDPRGIMPLYGFRLHKRLERTALRGRFTVTADAAFEAVMRSCAAPAPGRESTWITEEIITLFCALHREGFAHSIETWHEGALVGGLYGVALGAAFFGESMFSRETDASKVALVHLVARLRLAGFRLLDTQFGTSHLAAFGGVEIPARSYKAALADALPRETDWDSVTDAEILSEIRRMREECRS